MLDAELERTQSEADALTRLLSACEAAGLESPEIERHNGPWGFHWRRGAKWVLAKACNGDFFVCSMGDGDYFECPTSKPEDAAAAIVARLAAAAG